MADVAIRIAEIRRSKGLTQQDLADLREVTPHWIRQVESGRLNMKIATLVGIAEALGTDVKDLFEPPTASKARPGRPRRPSR